MMAVRTPALQGRTADTIERRAIDTEILREGRIQESFGKVAWDRLVLEVEFVLPMNVSQIDIGQ